MVANTPLRTETTGYPTQKPLKLLDRIVRASSVEGSLVVDPFCGSGTTLVAAAGANRSFVGCDIGELAVRTTCARLDAGQIPYRLVSPSEPGNGFTGARAVPVAPEVVAGMR